ncbi:MAG TPA: hypothetical protein VHC49_12730 [Mycobacteriales bacterium]|nr:hypothetical protein [Mycobacteriales bacterium]
MSHTPKHLFTVVTLADGETWINAHQRAVAALTEQAQKRGAAGVTDVAIAQVEDKTLILTADMWPVHDEPGAARKRRPVAGTE